MVFLNQVSHLGVCRRQRVGPLHQDILLTLPTKGVQHFLYDILFRDTVAHILLLQFLNDAGFQRVERLQLFLFLHQDDMIARRCQYRLTDLADLQGIGRILKLLEGLLRSYPSQQTAIASGLTVIREPQGDIIPVSTVLQHLVDGICPKFGDILISLGCIRKETDKDMSRMDQSLRTNLLLRLVIGLMSRLHDIRIRHEGWTHLLVAVHRKLLFEGRQRIQLGIQCRRHLQLIVDKQIHIFIDGLLIDHTI